jgi:hypothetical protein
MAFIRFSLPGGVIPALQPILEAGLTKSIAVIRAYEGPGAQKQRSGCPFLDLDVVVGRTIFSKPLQ